VNRAADPYRYPYVATRTDAAGHERCVHCGDRTDDSWSPHRIGCGEMTGPQRLFDLMPDAVGESGWKP
jgi:hypothetical protein